MAGRSSPVLMIRPRVKIEHAPYQIADGKVRIGGVSYGIAAEIADPDGWVWAMLAAMDGSRTMPEIIEYVGAAHPDQPVTVLRGAAEQLVRSGYVEDAAAPAPAVLSERDIQRYDRAVGYFRWLDLIPRQSSWEPQALLKDARVTILGVGGTGGTAAMALAAAGVGHLHLVDPDLVELSNLSRQVIYSEENIGTPKANSAVGRLSALNGDIEVTGQQLAAGCERDVLAVAGDCDVLLLAADRPPGLRTWVNRACLTAKRTWVDAGYHGPVAQVAAFVPGAGPMLGVHPVVSSRSARRDRPAAGPYAAPDGGGLRRGWRGASGHLWIPGRSPGHRAAHRHTENHPGPGGDGEPGRP